MKTIFRATDDFLNNVRMDLGRPHPFAAERVGFVSIRAAAIPDGVLLLAEQYYPVADEDYVDDPTVGAMMGQEAIRKALNFALRQSAGMFHVHAHPIQAGHGLVVQICESKASSFRIFLRCLANYHMEQ